MRRCGLAIANLLTSRPRDSVQRSHLRDSRWGWQPAIVRDRAKWADLDNSGSRRPAAAVPGHHHQCFERWTRTGVTWSCIPCGIFDQQPFFYVDYTRQSDGAVVISRFQVSTNSNGADTNSEQIVKVISKPYDNHNGGQLAFGPDGFLYIGVGDGGSEGDPLNNAQSTNTLLGKILRSDVESGVSPYRVPADNPLVGNSNALPEIWAYGLRNPWRFSFDRLTGDLYIGDVGEQLYEEIDFQPAGSPGGQNYGWRIIEGPVTYNVPPGFTNFSALTAPVAWYNHYILPILLLAQRQPAPEKPVRLDGWERRSAFPKVERVVLDHRR